MNTKEKSLWNWLSKDFGKQANLDWQRVENGCKGGTPDVELCDHNTVSWIELKVADTRAGGLWKVSFRPLQTPWQKRRWNKGGNVFTLIRAGRKHYLIRGCDVAQIEDEAVSCGILEQLSLVPPNAKPQHILDACKTARTEA